MASSYPSSQLRSLYRRILRELPSRQPSNLVNPSPIQQRIRTQVATQSTSQPSQLEIKQALQAADQMVQYVKAQRLYTTLIERYNPGMNMSTEDKVKLTARRVGMDMPDEWLPGRNGGSGSGGADGQ